MLGNPIKALSLVSVLALAAACSDSGNGRPSTPSATATTATASATTAQPSASTPAPVERLTTACPLLSPEELKAALGSAGSSTTVTAAEGKPDPAGGYTSYSCQYGGNGRVAFVLVVSGIPDPSLTPQAAVTNIGRASQVATRAVTGAGGPGVFYTLPQRVSVIAVAKKTGGEVRTVVFSAPAIVPQQKFVEVAKVVMARI